MRPAYALPVRVATTAARKAPPSSWPSIAMLTMPDALAEHTGERTEDERDREEQRALQQAGQRHRVRLARDRPHEEREDHEDAERDRQPERRPCVAPGAP